GPGGVLRRDVLLAGRRAGRAAGNGNRVVHPGGARSRRGEIDGANVVVGGRQGPGLVGIVVLAQVAILRDAVIMDGIQSIHSHSFGGIGDDSFSVLRGGRCEREQGEIGCLHNSSSKNYVIPSLEVKARRWLPASSGSIPPCRSSHPPA